jgi:hypothetical protein
MTFRSVLAPVDHEAVGDIVGPIGGRSQTAALADPSGETFECAAAAALVDGPRSMEAVCIEYTADVIGDPPSAHFASPVRSKKPQLASSRG